MCTKIALVNMAVYQSPVGQHTGKDPEPELVVAINQDITGPLGRGEPQIWSVALLEIGGEYGWNFLTCSLPSINVPPSNRADYSKPSPDFSLSMSPWTHCSIIKYLIVVNLLGSHPSNIFAQYSQLPLRWDLSMLMNSSLGIITLLYKRILRSVNSTCFLLKAVSASNGWRNNIHCLFLKIPTGLLP